MGTIRFKFTAAIQVVGVSAFPPLAADVFMEGEEDTAPVHRVGIFVIDRRLVIRGHRGAEEEDGDDRIASVLRQRIEVPPLVGAGGRQVRRLTGIVFRAK